jgi:acyl dehydratase
VTASALPDSVTSVIGVLQYEEEADFPVERGYFWSYCSAAENGNPLFWDDDVAERLTGGPVAPPSMLSAWFRPHHWAPGRSEPKVPLQVHFDMKEALGLPEAIMSDYSMTFFDPVRPGDRITSGQKLVSVSDVKDARVGTGRFWVIDVEYRNQGGDLVGVETWTGFGYRRPDQRHEANAREAGGT